MAALPNLRASVKPVFPATVSGAGGIQVVKSNGVYTIKQAYDQLDALPGVVVGDLPNLFLSVYDSVGGGYQKVSFSNFLTGLATGLDPDLLALANNTNNGLWARTGDGTGAARTITGTANKITVTNGDGVAGNPTLTLPSAISLNAITADSLALGGATLGGNALAVTGAASFSTDVVAGGSYTLGGPNVVLWNGRAKIASPADGYLTLLNNAATDFTMLRLGGTTSSFPGIKRSGSGIAIRVADDTAYAAITAGQGAFTGNVQAVTSTAIPAGGTQDVGYLFSTTAHFGAIFGSGAATASMARGSIYLRSDGVPAYNTNGTTGWDDFVGATATQTLTNKTLTAAILTTPALGVATANSLAIGGATIGSNALAVTGAVNFSAGLIIGTDMTIGASSVYAWNGRTLWSAPADGQALLRDSTGTTFSRLMLGGTTSSFPAIKRNGAGIDLRLADDSGYAALATSTLTISGAANATGTVRAQNATAIPAGGTAGTGFLFSSATNFGIAFGSGAPTLAMAQGSLYLRSDGAPHFNTDGATGWTSLATPAITNVTGLGAGIATFLATPSSANLRAALTDESGTGALYFQGGDIGSPSAGVLTNATGLPIATGVAGLGTGIATFLGTPSSANLRAAVTDETGSGALVFGTNPTISGATISGGTATFADANFTLQDDGDATKQAKFQLSGLTTATTRTYTLPDASTTLVGTDATQTLTNKSIVATQLTGTLAAGQFPALTGDVTTVAGALATTIANGAVSNAKMANAAAFTLKGNATGSAAAPQDFLISGLTHKAAPASTDIIMISDEAASHALKYATLAEVLGSVTSGVSSIAGNTGAFTLSTGITNSGNDIRIDRGQIPGTTTNDNASSGNVGESRSSGAKGGAQSTVTITIASPGVVTYTGHGLSTGMAVHFTTTGALPTGLSPSTNYYVIFVDANNFQLATTCANAFAGIAINTSGSQSGTHTCMNRALLTSGATRCINGLQLTAGDWMVWASSAYGGDAVTALAVMVGEANQTEGSIAQVPGTFGKFSGYDSTATAVKPFTASSGFVLDAGPMRISVSGSVNIYLNAFASFTGGNTLAGGALYAIRIR